MGGGSSISKDPAAKYSGERRVSVSSLQLQQSQKRQRLVDLQHDDNEDEENASNTSSNPNNNNNNNQVDASSGVVGKVTVDVQPLLYQAFIKVLHIREKAISDPFIQLLFRGLDKVYYPKNTILMTEGEAGNKLFIIESGKVQISIQGNPVRLLERGAVFGELALFFDSPRSATAATVTGCVVWTLNRKIFQQVQRELSENSLISRIEKMKTVTQFSALSTHKLASFISEFGTHTFEAEEDLIRRGDFTSKIFLIESGLVLVDLKDVPGINYNDLSTEEVCERLCIPFIPFEASESSNRSSATCPEIKGIKLTGSELFLTPGCIIGLGSLFGKARLTHGWHWHHGKSEGDSKKIGAEAPVSFTAVEPTSVAYFTVARFEQEFGSCAQALSSEQSMRSDREDPATEMAQVEFAASASGSQFRFTGYSDFSGMRLLGSIDMGMVAVGRRVTPISNTQTPQTANATSNSPSKTPGAVASPQDVREDFILKIYSKQLVVQNKQVKHIAREVAILKSLHSPFVAKIFGSFQTPNEVVFVLERILGSDLYHLVHHIDHFRPKAATTRLTRFMSSGGGSIHISGNNNSSISNSNNNNGNSFRNRSNTMALQVASNTSNRIRSSSRGDFDETLVSSTAGTFTKGLSLDLATFYLASLVIALGYLRSQGIAYRNVKPENLMIDDKGYLKLVGFGFSKKIPYKEEANKSRSKSTGVKLNYLYKTYTLCGSPEYMAPEMLTRSGHDHAVDNWSFGILAHEICTGKTPFGAATAEEVFKNITEFRAKKKSIVEVMDTASFAKYGESAAVLTSLIAQALALEPSERPSFRFGDQSGFFGHSLFSSVNWEGIRDATVTAPFIPEARPMNNLDTMETPTFETFSGNDRLFREF